LEKSARTLISVSEGLRINARRLRSVRVATLFMTVFLGACDSSSDGPPIPIDDFASLLADAVCNNIGPCCQRAGFPHAPAACHARAESSLQSEVAKRRGANVAYDGNAARACVDTYTAVARTCADDRDIGSVCRRVFSGTLAAGAMCMLTPECVPGASCEPPLDGGAGQCSRTRFEHNKRGDHCFATCTEDLKSGLLYCSGVTGDPGEGACHTTDGLYCDVANLCAAIPTLNQLCVGDAPCAEEAFCENNVCVAKRTSGSCGPFSDGCAATAYCEFGTGLCQPRKATGEACSGEECLDSDTCNATCRPRTIANANTCSGVL